jgi:hypothetical protein
VRDRWHLKKLGVGSGNTAGICPASASRAPPYRRGASIRTGVEFRSLKSQRNFKAGGVGISRKPEDQTKNSFSNRQILNNVSFPTFDFF